jgi:hypothetical protein
MSRVHRIKIGESDKPNVRPMIRIVRLGPIACVIEGRTVGGSDLQVTAAAPTVGSKESSSASGARAKLKPFGCPEKGKFCIIGGGPANRGLGMLQMSNAK